MNNSISYKYLLNWINEFLLKNKTTIVHSSKTRDKFLKKNYLDNYNNIISLTSFLDESVKVLERIYCIINNIDDIVICNNKDCNNKVDFIRFSIGYKKYCCKKCQQLDIKSINIKRFSSSKKTCLERYGVDNVLKSNIIRNKIKQTCIKKYGVDHISKSDIIKNKIKKTCLDKHGVDCVLKSDIIKNKIKNTMIEKYGVDNAFQSKKIRNKIKQTCIKKYGVDHISKSDIIKNKIKNTMIEKYGVDNALKSDIIKHKIKQTCIKKHGVDHISKSNIIRNKIKKTCLDKYGVDNALKSDLVKNKIKKAVTKKYGVDCVLKSDIIKNKIKQTCIKKYGVDHISKSNIIRNKIKKTCLDKYGVDNFSQVSLHKKNMLDKMYNKNWLQYQHYDLKKSCVDIAKEFNLSFSSVAYFMHKNNIDIKIRSFSTPEKEIVEFINLDNIETNTRKIIHPLELDIYIPNYNLAIEFNGLYWHSKNDKNYHLNKTKLCLNKDIQLFHIFENEWTDSIKQDIWKSIINNKIGRSSKIFARKCVAREIDNKLSKEFLDNNHLQGNVGSSVKLGLFYNNKLVSLMTFGKTRFSKKYEWEMIRFCNKKYINVIGGASKLYKYFINKYKPISVISYADRRYSNGNLYEKLGFEFSHCSDPNYWYFKNNKLDLHSRLKFQKHKLNKLLENFNSNKSEIENMVNNGYLRIFDCGNIIYIKKMVYN